MLPTYVRHCVYTIIVMLPSTLGLSSPYVIVVNFTIPCIVVAYVYVYSYMFLFDIV